jgi:hypothetical protein
MKKLLATVVLAMVVTGCAQQTFIVKNDVAITPKQITTHHFFVAGIGQKKTIEARVYCS